MFKAWKCLHCDPLQDIFADPQYLQKRIEVKLLHCKYVHLFTKAKTWFPQETLDKIYSGFTKNWSKTLCIKLKPFFSLTDTVAYESSQEKP